MEVRKIRVLVSRLICLLFIFSNFGHIVGAGVQKQASASTQQPTSASGQNEYVAKSIIQQPFKVLDHIALENLGANRRVGSGVSAEIERPATNKNIITKLHGIFKRYWYIFMPVMGAGALLVYQFKNKSDAQKFDNKQEGGAALQSRSLKLSEEQQALCEKVRQARDKLLVDIQSRKNSLKEQYDQGKLTEAQLNEQVNALSQDPHILHLKRELEAATKKLRPSKDQSVQSGIVAQEPEIPVSRPKLTEQEVARLQKEYNSKMLASGYSSLEQQQAYLAELYNAGGINAEEVTEIHGRLWKQASLLCENARML